MNLNIFPHNLIAEREIRVYQRTTKIWMQKFESVGVAALVLISCLLFVLHWWSSSLKTTPSNFYFYFSLEGNAFIQLFIGSIYALALVRCITAGVRIAHRNRQFPREDILLTEVDRHTFIFGQWYAGLYELYGWMTALCCIRITTVVIMGLNNELVAAGNPGYLLFHPGQIVLAIILAAALSFLDVRATVGIGLLAGTWIRNPILAWFTATLVRAMPVLIFTWFPIFDNSSFDYLTIRWYEYTWFAFVDGGTSALLRFILPAVIPFGGFLWLLKRGTVEFLAASSMLAVYETVAFVLMDLHFSHFSRRNSN